ncbi:hypothetical protein AB0L57_16025 [Nocardia sp. NPDC052254]|uniref:hypothetical protein n=1 Tax=Nocardia sp. NPDC052254 TaxID=3155681 RepID=UPI003431A911
MLATPVVVALILVIASGIFVATRFSGSDDSFSASRTTAPEGRQIPMALLRSVDPCGLVNEVPPGAGTPTGKGAGYPMWSECQLRTQGGTYGTLVIDLRLDDDIRGYTFDTPDASDHINGLRVGHKKTDLLGRKPGECGVAVPTENRELVVGLAVSGVSGADPCTVVTEFFTPIVQRLGANPPRHPSPPGSLVAVDPCSVLDLATLEPIIGRTGAGVPDAGVHQCEWSGTVALTAQFSVERESKVKSTGLTRFVAVGPIPFYEEHLTDGLCTYTYIQLTDLSDFAETAKVTVQSQDKSLYPQLCDKARTAAAALVPKLPKTR